MSEKKKTKAKKIAKKKVAEKSPTSKVETKVSPQIKSASQIRKDFAEAAQGKDSATKARLKAQLRIDLAAAKAS